MHSICPVISVDLLNSFLPEVWYSLVLGTGKLHRRLKKHDAEYQRLQKKILEFTEKFINKKYDTIVNENEFSKSELGGMKIFY